MAPVTQQQKTAAARTIVGVRDGQQDTLTPSTPNLHSTNIVPLRPTAHSQETLLANATLPFSTAARAKFIATQISKTFELLDEKVPSLSQHFFLSRLEDFKAELEFFKEIALRVKQPIITFYGGARAKKDSQTYQLGIEAAKEAATQGFAVMTGGGPGVMEAANYGCKLGNSEMTSLGARIFLPFEKGHNPFIDILSSFNHFPYRKEAMLACASAFFIFPGGFGTMDELYEILTIQQCHRSEPRPIILMGKKFWTPLIEFMKSNMLNEKFISASDLNLFHLTDSPDKAINYMRSYITNRDKEFVKLHEKLGTGEDMLALIEKVKKDNAYAYLWEKEYGDVKLLD